MSKRLTRTIRGSRRPKRVPCTVSSAFPFTRRVRLEANCSLAPRFCSTTSTPRSFASAGALTSLTLSAQHWDSSPFSACTVIGPIGPSYTSPLTSTSIEVISLGANCPASRPNLCARLSQGPNFSRISEGTDGTLTAFRMLPLQRKSTNCSASATATLRCASSVEAPRCGVQMKLSSFSSG